MAASGPNPPTMPRVGIGSPPDGENEAKAEGDEDEPGRALEEVGGALPAAEPAGGGAGNRRHPEIHQSPRDVEQQSEEDNLERGESPRRVDELGQKGEEEQGDLGIEDVGDHALP